MCTVSWTGRPGGYDLFFNRDELATRAPELPPAAAQRDGATYAAPRDGDHGGTWLLANEFGLTICLLNDYASTWRPADSAPRISRGHVVLACASAADHAGVTELLQRQPLARAPAFQLLALAPDEGALVLHWNGTRLESRVCAGGLPLLSSSSFDTAAVIARRIACFRAMVRSPHRPAVEELAAFHRQHERGESAYSVLMRRPDAATRSVIHVTVRPDQVGLRYEPVRWAMHRAVMLAPTRVSLPRSRARGGSK